MADDTQKRQWSRKDYWHVGPVFIRKPWFLMLVIAGAAAVLALFGLPFSFFTPGDTGPPTYWYGDKALQEVSGRVRIVDSAGVLRYEGDVVNGVYSGQGAVYDSLGRLVYVGPLEDGFFQGDDGALYREGKLYYKGQMAGNRCEGLGQMFHPDTGRCVAEGTFLDGKLEGTGKEYTSDGSLLREGTFAAGLLEGQGREYSTTGVLLREGTFSAGLLHGQGTQWTEEGAMLYQGAFSHGVYQGEGILYDPQTGSIRYSGSFRNGQPMGYGTLYHTSGQALYTGQVWQDRPRGDAFLGLSLAELEEAFAEHWVLYIGEDEAAFVYPTFGLMFFTDCPITLVTAEGQGEELSPALSPKDLVINEVLSYGDLLPGVPQPDTSQTVDPQPVDWRDWFSSYALGRTASPKVEQTGPFVYRFTRPEQGIGARPAWTASGSGLGTLLVLDGGKDGTVLWQSAWREEEP